MDIKAQPITDIEHPVDGIGNAGMDEVRNLLIKEGVLQYSYEFESVIEEVGCEWIVKKGKYAGTFPKRIAKSIKAKYKKKIDPTILGNLGELAKRHTVEAKGYRIDFTSDFSWRAGDFGDEGSCFWGDHGGAKDMILNAGGLAVRFYEDDGWGSDKGYGRAWMLPYGKHWVIFNTYGKHLTTITVARILATEMGWSYKRIRFHNNGDYDHTLWINGARAYLIGETGKIEDIDSVDLRLTDEHRGGEYVCAMCDERMDDYFTVNGSWYCSYCYEDNFFYCEGCNCDRYTADSSEVYYWMDGRMRYYSQYVCDDCHYDAIECKVCNRRFMEALNVVDHSEVCNDCIEDLDTCEDCDERILTPHVHIEYPRNTNGTFANRVETVRCHDCHFNREED